MNIVIRQEQNPTIVCQISGNFVEDSSYNKNVIASEIWSIMANRPDSICVLIGYLFEEIVGHIVAWIPDNRQYIWIDQIWHKNSLEKEIVEKGYEMLVEWAKECGINELRAETERSSLAIARKWGFEEHGVIVRKQI